jgi:hypothetical protein
MNSLTRATAIGCAAVLLAGGLAACRTTPPVLNGGERVMVLPDGNVSVDGRIASVEDLPGRLRSAGFDKAASIRVGIPGTPSQTLLARVSSVLASNGYLRVIFVKPRAARVVTDVKTTPKPVPPR